MNKKILFLLTLFLLLCLLPVGVFAQTGSTIVNLEATIPAYIEVLSTQTVTGSIAVGTSAGLTFNSATACNANLSVAITITGLSPGHTTPTFSRQRRNLSDALILNEYDELVTTFYGLIDADETTNPTLTAGSTPANFVAWAPTAFDHDRHIGVTVTATGTNPPSNATTGPDAGKYTLQYTMTYTAKTYTP